MTFKRFEDILVWQKSLILAEKIYVIFGNIRDFGFRDQIQRSAVSVMNNIAEGYERKSNKEFRQFLYISKGSCGEVRSMLILAKNLKLSDKKTIEELLLLAEEISKMLSGLIKTL